jgi:lysophospholipase L1-like esterase
MNNPGTGIAILVCATLTAAPLSAAAAAPVSGTATGVAAMVEQVLTPFWRSTTMQGESLFFCERKTGEVASAMLLFPPEKILSVTSATGETTYEEGKDFAIDMPTGVLRLLPGSRIPCKTMGEMYPPADSTLPKIGRKRGDPQTFLIFSEGRFMHDLQVAVTYTHKDGLWAGYVPKFSGAVLTNAMRKLHAKEPFKLCLTGDSISAGANASKKTKAPPFQPCFGELVGLGLEKAFGAKVTFRNFGVGGWASGGGLSAIDKVAAEKPDLVIIAFGMNDTGGLPASYLANIRGMIEKVRASAPEAEFILVSSMLPNPEWNAPRPENFPIFRSGLTGLCGPGVALADMTTMWEDLRKRKSFHDLTGNGVNHPNDFGHRVYASVILGLLVE